MKSVARVYLKVGGVEMRGKMYLEKLEKRQKMTKREISIV